jgi:ABC-type multidrug transport system ATPase subunit
VLFLDEPTTGVDPVSRREFWLVLKHLRESGMTVMVSTPYMEEAGQCGRIAFIKEGSILYSETPGRIVESFGETLYAVSSDRMHTLLDDVRSFAGIKYCYSFGDSHHFVVDESFSGEKALAGYLAGIGYGNITVKKIQPTMEDCYMKLSLR